MSTETPTAVELALPPEATLARRACVVLLGGQPFAVDAADAREVVVLGTTTPVPGAPPSVIGVMNLRGNVLPVVEARPVLGLSAHTRSDRALVLAAGEWCAAIVIEGVVGLAPLDGIDASAASAGDLTVGQVIAETGDRARLLDTPALLAAIRRAWDPVSGG
ncbi:MAG TPA: chemotaxis protein CheW [Methylomirabilota bacterium]